MDPYTPKPSILNRVLGRLFPTDQYGELLSPVERNALQRQSLLQLGTGILGQTGPGTNAATAFGRAYQGIDFGDMAMKALQVKAYRDQLANQAAVQEVFAKHPKEQGQGAYEWLSDRITELAGKPGSEHLIGPLSNALAQMRPKHSGRLIRSIELDERGMPQVILRDPETGEVVNVGGRAYVPPTGTIPSEGERRAGALLTTADAAFNLLQNAQAPNLKDYLAGKIPLGLGQGAISARQQMQNQAGAQFYRSYLYIVSGATVNPNEAEEAAKTFVPQWGDDPELVQQKLDQQKVMIEAMRQAAGRAVPAAAPGAPQHPHNPFRKPQ